MNTVLPAFCVGVLLATGPMEPLRCLAANPDYEGAAWDAASALVKVEAGPAGSDAAEPAGEPSGPEPGACELQIQGTHIEKLVLESDTGRVIQLNRPEPKVSLPAGRYRLREVHLQGGYRSRSADQEWLTLAPDEPCRIQVGSPLRPHVKVTRRGRLLKLDYEVRDAVGREYSGSRSGRAPRFAVYMGDREIGSGSFEYG